MALARAEAIARHIPSRRASCTVVGISRYGGAGNAPRAQQLGLRVAVPLVSIDAFGTAAVFDRSTSPEGELPPMALRPLRYANGRGHPARHRARGSVAPSRPPSRGRLGASERDGGAQFHPAAPAQAIVRSVAHR